MILYEWHETIQWININRSGCDVLRWCCESLRFGCMACRQIRVRIQHHLLGYCWHDWSFSFVSTGWFHVGSQDKSGSRWARIGLAWDWCRRLGAEYKQKRFGYVPLGYRRRCRWFHLTIHDGSWSCGQNIGLAWNWHRRAEWKWQRTQYVSLGYCWQCWERDWQRLASSRLTIGTTCNSLVKMSGAVAGVTGVISFAGQNKC